MAIPTPPLPVLRFAGLLAGTDEQLAAARDELVDLFGPIEDVSPIVPFTFTTYYQDEMGSTIVRQWVRFRNLTAPDRLAEAKRETNRVETVLARRFRKAGIPRPVNIDPGYVHRYKVILATTKDHAHRIYLSDGIYAEVTLHWHQNTWTPWPWTYADYRSDAAIAFLTDARTAYLQHLQRITAGK